MNVHLISSLALMVVVVLSLWSGSHPTASADAPVTSPPKPEAATYDPMPRQVLTDHEGGIRAVVAKSWSECNSAAVAWATLNQNWPLYGTIPIEIDYANPALCAGDVTYEELVASDADVIIISDPAGGGEQYSAGDVAAITQYLQEGRTLIGTFLVFQFHTVDNRLLAPLFGLPQEISYNTRQVLTSQTYELLEPENPLFRNLTNPYQSLGFHQAQVPMPRRTWWGTVLPAARYLAHTPGARGVITLHEAPGYQAIYISSMPENYSGTQDLQFLYNAITYPH